MKIDLTKYRTDELIETTIELVGLPRALAELCKQAAIWFVAFMGVLMLLVIFFDGQPILSVKGMGLIIYGLAAAIITGIWFGVVRLTYGLLNNLGRLLQQILDIVKWAAADVASLRTGEQKLPTAVELTRAVYEQVILPVIETAVAQNFGILGKPLLWGYRATIGRAVRSLTARMSENEELAVVSLTPDELKGVLNQASQYQQRIEQTIDPIQKSLESGTSTFKRVLLLPVLIVFLAALLVFVTPIMIAIFVF